MANQTLLSLSLANWVVAFAYFSPLALVNRDFMYRRPALGLWLWLSLFFASVAALVAAIGIACWSVFETWAKLNSTALGSDRWFEALLISFSPWLVLALAGVVTALANQKLEGLFVRTNRPDPVTLGAIQVSSFGGFPVLELPVAFAYVGSSATSRSILVASGTRQLLNAAELEACFEHEAHHLRAHHGRLTALLSLAMHSIGSFAATQAMVSEASLLIELAADSSVVDTEALKGALRKIGGNDRETRVRLSLLSK